jgi:ATP-dependent DNA helicase RecG
MVALLSMLMVLDNGYQACLMAPTEILASQHFQSVTEALAAMDIRVGLLTGSTKTAHRRFLLEELKEGRLQILIGTHALIEDRVQFQQLGLVVIDEQHRFGVQQRAKLWQKDEFVPHVLVMTATPIPRTLAMTLYGDLDTSVIDELPPGRKPIQTIHKTESNRLAVFGFMKQEIAKGRQVYVVYPLIEESEKMDYTNLMEGYDSICKEFPLPQYQVSVVNGRMKPADKDFEMNRFKEGKAHIMVATTVIEVGVNVPNASVMIIESAERFGLSQLHQLRGRVGRGAEQSYCILMTAEKLGNDARLRMKTMTGTNDGFKIAEVDLELRGPGDLAGTQQSGVVNLHIASLSKDKKIMEVARTAASEVLQQDERLILPSNAMLVEQLRLLDEMDANYSRVS